MVKPRLLLQATVAFILVLSCPLPAAYAAVSGPFDLWITVSVTGADHYPGGYLYFNYEFINTWTGSITITQIRLVTPWQTFSDTSVPITFSPGQDYEGYFNVTIPSSQKTGTSTLNFTSSETDFNPTNLVYTIAVIPNPYTLQNQVNSLNSQVSSLQSQVSSLQAQLSTAQSQVTSLQATVSSLTSDISNKTAQINTLNGDLASAKSDIANKTAKISDLTAQVDELSTQLAKAESELSDKQAKIDTLTSQLQTAQGDISKKTTQINGLTAQLADTKTSLTNVSFELGITKSELSNYSSIYLPIGVAIPSVVAAAFAALLRRK